MNRWSEYEVPTTMEEFDITIHEVCARYGFTDRALVTSVVCLYIRHMPTNEATLTTEQLGNAVKRAMTNIVINEVRAKQSDELYLQGLVAKLETNPLDQQAVDELTQAASNGYEPAIKALEALNAKES